MLKIASEQQLYSQSSQLLAVQCGAAYSSSKQVRCGEGSEGDGNTVQRSEVKV
jgi:hypothetical protein